MVQFRPVSGCRRTSPIRRRHAKRNLLKLAEEIDNNETALTSDQIAKRYRAEVAASSQANSSVSAASIAAAVKRAAQQEQASRASLPDTSSGQANSAPLVGQGMLSEQAVAPCRQCGWLCRRCSRWQQKAARY